VPRDGPHPGVGISLLWADFTLFTWHLQNKPILMNRHYPHVPAPSVISSGDPKIIQSICVVPRTTVNALAPTERNLTFIKVLLPLGFVVQWVVMCHFAFFGSIVHRRIILYSIHPFAPGTLGIYSAIKIARSRCSAAYVPFGPWFHRVT